MGHTDLRQTTFHPQGELSQSRKHLVKGHHKQGNRPKHSHQRPEIKTSLPWKGKIGHSGDSVATTSSLKSSKKPTYEDSTTSASLVVQQVEVKMRALLVA